MRLRLGSGWAAAAIVIVLAGCGGSSSSNSAQDFKPKFTAAVDVFCLIEDETLRADSLKLVQNLRAAGLTTEYALAPSKSDKQFKRAQELQAAHTIKLERLPTGELQARVKNLKTREEKTVNPAEAVAQLRG